MKAEAIHRQTRQQSSKPTIEEAARVGLVNLDELAKSRSPNIWRETPSRRRHLRAAAKGLAILFFKRRFGRAREIEVNRREWPADGFGEEVKAESLHGETLD